MHCDPHISDDTHIYKGHEHIEGTAARLAFVRDYLSQGADANTRLEE